MKHAFFSWLRRLQFPLLILLSVFPLMLSLLCLHAPQAIPAFYALCAAYMLAGGVCLAAPAARRLAAGGLCSAGMLALSAALLPLRAQPLLLLLPAALSALLFFALPIAGRRYESDVPPYVYAAGIGIHVVIHFLHYYFAKTGGVSPYAPVSSALTASLIAYMLLLLLSMNRISLDNASLARHRLPSGMRLLNSLMTLAFLAASLLLALSPAVVRGVTSLWHAMLALARRLGALLLSLFPASEDYGAGVGGPPEAMFMPAGDAPPSGPFAKLLETLASILTTIILVVGCVCLLYLLTRLLRRLVRSAAQRLRRYITAAAAEYEDEITDTRSDGAQREIRFLRRAPHRPKDTAHTPQSRIRLTYARLLRRRPDWPESSTARENLPPDAASLYERARYSSHPMTNEDAARFAAGAKKTKER